MAPMLLAVATFALTLLVQTRNPRATITDELFALLSAACLFLGSATIADSAMDSCRASGSERLKFLGGGYLLFCIAIGAISTVIPIVYLEQAGAAPIALWRYLLFAATGVVVLVKPLLSEERSWTYADVWSIHPDDHCVSRFHSSLNRPQSITQNDRGLLRPETLVPKPPETSLRLSRNLCLSVFFSPFVYRGAGIHRVSA